MCTFFFTAKIELNYLFSCNINFEFIKFNVQLAEGRKWYKNLQIPPL